MGKYFTENGHINSCQFRFYAEIAICMFCFYMYVLFKILANIGHFDILFSFWRFHYTRFEVRWRKSFLKFHIAVFRVPFYIRIIFTSNFPCNPEEMQNKSFKNHSSWQSLLLRNEIEGNTISLLFFTNHVFNTLV